MLGPFLNLHLAGGTGGIAALFDKPHWHATEAMWLDLGIVAMDDGLRRQVADGVAKELASRDQHGVIRQRDAVLLELLQAQAGAKDCRKAESRNR